MIASLVQTQLLGAVLHLAGEQEIFSWMIWAALELKTHCSAVPIEV